MKRDILVIRMTSAVLSVFFGSLWIALYISREVAPPEPEIASVLRPLFLGLCIASSIWALILYRSFRREGQQAKQTDAETRENPNRNAG